MTNLPDYREFFQLVPPPYWIRLGQLMNMAHGRPLSELHKRVKHPQGPVWPQRWKSLKSTLADSSLTLRNIVDPYKGQISEFTEAQFPELLAALNHASFDFLQPVFAQFEAFLSQAPQTDAQMESSAQSATLPVVGTTTQGAPSTDQIVPDEELKSWLTSFFEEHKNDKKHPPESEIEQAARDHFRPRKLCDLRHTVRSTPRPPEWNERGRRRGS